MNAILCVARASLATVRRSRLSVNLTIGLLFAIVASCGKSDGGPNPSGPPAATTGSLAITVTGLPVGAPASVTVTGPSGFSRTLTATEMLATLAPGSYTISADRVMAGAVAYDADASLQSVSVSAGAVPATASVSYGVRTGALALVVSGLPDGAAGAVTVSGPGGFTNAVSQNTTLPALTPGTYSIVAASVAAMGHTFAPGVASQTVVIVAGTSPTSASIGYSIITGAIAVSIDGLPGGVSGTANLTGPNGYTHGFTGTETVTNLAPGSYALTAGSVLFGGDSYLAPGGAMIVAITPSMTPVAAAVNYALATGRLQVSASGLPSGAAPAFSVTGPAGFTRSATAGETVTGLAPGSYNVAAPTVASGPNLYSPSTATQNVTVAATAVASQVTFGYAVTSGGLTVAVAGLPQSVPASITITGPAGYSNTIAATAALTGLKVGSYTIAAANATAGSHIYAPTPATQSVTVQAGTTTSASTVIYALASGSIALTINGIAPVQANVTVTGPGGYNHSITATGLLLGLTPGSYTISAGVVTNLASSYAPSTATQSVTVVASLSAISVTVNYIAASGSLALSVTGLPGGVNGNVTVTGPGGYSQHATASDPCRPRRGDLYRRGHGGE